MENSYDEDEVDQLSFQSRERTEQITQRRTTVRSLVSDEHKSKQLTTYTLSMLNFIPATILQQLSTETTTQLILPLNYKSKSVVLVAELQYFYDQANQLSGDAQDEKEINEYLVGVCHGLLENLSSILTKFGGDLIQFLGASMIAIWPGGDDFDACRRAASCALEISKEAQKFLPQAEQKKNETVQQLSTQLCIGIGFGDIQILHMGGILNRIEFFVAGQAFNRAISALRMTDSSIPIAASSEMWPMLDEFFQGEKIENKKKRNIIFSPMAGENKKDDKGEQTDYYYTVVKIIQNIRPTRDANLQKIKNDDQLIKKCQAFLKSYIPGSYRQLSQLKQGETRYGMHLKVTILAIAIEFQQNLFDQQQKDSANLIVVQNIIQIVQAQVYKMEGAVTRISSYENGLIFVATFGMQHLTHIDDCARAVFAAQNIKQHLTKFQNSQEVDDESFSEAPVHVGIATGDVFQGVIGNFARREIVGIGEVAERAILLLRTATQAYGKIYVDADTKRNASHNIDFKFVDYYEYQNKIINTAVFEPISEQLQNYQNPESPELTNASKFRKSAKQQANTIRIHANPFFDDKESSYQKSFCDAYGRSDTIVSIIQDIEDYVHNDENFVVWVLGIRGAVGSGKSLFARRLLIEVAECERNIFLPYQEEFPTLHFEYFVCTSNSNNKMLFLGIWRPFIQHLLELYSVHSHQPKDYIIANQITQANIEDKVRTIEEIFNMKNLGKRSRHHRHKTNQSTQIGPQRFEESYEDNILLFCFDFIRHAIDFLRDEIYFFLVLDNVESMGCSSWRLFNLIQSHCTNMIIVMGIECSQNYFSQDPQGQVSNLDFKIDSDEVTQKFYKDFIKPREAEIFSIADMSPMTKVSLKQALLDLGPVYERTMTKEIEEMTRIIDTKNPLKTFSAMKEISIRLSAKYNNYSPFTLIEDQVLDEIWIKSQGNPLIAFQFCFQAIIQGFVENKEQELVKTQKFISAVQLNSWTGLSLPFLILKKMCVLLENALKIKLVGAATKLDNNMMVQLIQLLYTASVIGDSFGLKLIESSNKILVEKKNLYSTNVLLKELEDRDLIELISVDDESGELIYRFTAPFFRNALYQMQSYLTSKRETHLNIINHMQSVITQDYTTGWSLEKENLILLRHLMCVDKVYSEEMLSTHSRQILTLKKINQKFTKLQTKIKIGHLRLSMDGGKTDQLTFVILTQRKIEFFNEIKFGFAVNYERVATIDLKQITKVKPPKDFDKGTMFADAVVATTLQTTESLQEQQQKLAEAGFYFQLKVNKWEKGERGKNDITVKPQAQGVLIIGQADNSRKSKREAEDWMTAIEYLRTKLTYDNFVGNFGLVKFGDQKQQVSAQIGYVTEKNKERFGQQFLLKDSQKNNRFILKSISVNKTEDIKGSSSPNQADPHTLQRQNQVKSHAGKIEIQHLAKKIKAFYYVSTVTFFSHLKKQQTKSENPGLGEVGNTQRTAFLDICNDMNIEFSSESTSLIMSESILSEETPQNANDILDVVSEQKVIAEPNQEEVALTVEQRKVRRLTCLNDVWQEGSVIQESVKSRKDEGVLITEFKLNRRVDIFQYNLNKTPYKGENIVQQVSVIDETAQKPNSIIKISSEAKVPAKVRRPKAQGIEKVLENSNSPWFLEYLKHQQNLMIEQNLLTQKLNQSVVSKSQPPAVQHSVLLRQQSSRASIQQSQQSDHLKLELVQVKNLPQQTQMDSRTDKTTPMKSKNKGSITSRRGLLLVESVQSKKGDTGQIYDSTERPTSEDASFKDYQSGWTHQKSDNVTSQKAQQKQTNKKGCPVILQGDTPQYIMPRGVNLKLKAGDVVYLSEDLNENNQAVKCHVWHDKLKVEIVVARQDVIVPSDSAPVFPNQRQTSQKIAQLGGITSADDLLEKMESKESINRNMEYYSQVFGAQAYNSKLDQPNIATYIKRVPSKQHMMGTENSLLKKLQKRQEIRLRQKLLQQNKPLSDLLSTPQKKDSTQFQGIQLPTFSEHDILNSNTGMRDEYLTSSQQYPSNNNTPKSNQQSAVPALKMTERLRRKQERQLNI